MDYFYRVSSALFKSCSCSTPHHIKVVDVLCTFPILSLALSRVRMLLLKSKVTFYFPSGNFKHRVSETGEEIYGYESLRLLRSVTLF